MRILCYILVVLFATTSAVGQQINPVPDYIFRNSMSVGRNAPTDTSAYFSIGPRFGATRGFMPPMVVDTAAVTGTKRNGLLIYSIQRNSFLYWDSTGSRWSRLASLSDTVTLSTRAWRQKGIDSVASVRIGGSGTINRVPKFTASGTIGNGSIADSSSSVRMTILANGRVGINTSTDAGFQFDVNGTARTGTLTVNTNGQGRTISTNQASGTDGSNIFIGGAGASINGTSGSQSSYNTSLGSNALVALTTGNSNTSIGFESMQSNTTGSGNTAFGRNALRANTTANSNTSIGNTSMQLNTTGASNTAIGVSALSNNSTGSSNIAIGVTALGSNTTANNNVAIGFESMLSNSTGISNTAIGTNSLRANTTANSNTAIGLNAMYFNTTGATNVAVGIAAMQENTTGGNNSAFGSNALISNKTGSNNTAIGFEAGRYINSGANNDTANNSIYIGYDARSSANNRTNEVVIGYQGRGNGSNTVTIGNSSTTDNYFTGALRTSAPPGGTANAWRLGTVATVTPTSPNRTIEVSIGGTIYYIHAKTTND